MHIDVHNGVNQWLFLPLFLFFFFQFKFFFYIFHLCTSLSLSFLPFLVVFIIDHNNIKQSIKSHYKFTFSYTKNNKYKQKTFVQHKHLFPPQYIFLHIIKHYIVYFACVFSWFLITYHLYKINIYFHHNIYFYIL